MQNISNDNEILFIKNFRMILSLLDKEIISDLDKDKIKVKT